MYDIVGDIHGHADKLAQLLKVLGYTKSGNLWSHPERKLISIGDLVDRGPHQREVIDILKPMADAGHAVVLMGNHEFNAVSWALKDSNGNYLRAHSEKNYAQHQAFLEQADVNSEWYQETIEWFMSLPLLFETPNFRCVHAAWDSENINYLKRNLKDDCTLHINQWQDANDESHSLYNAIEFCLKGPEINLPEGHYFYDGGGHKRTKMRLKWWGINSDSTYRSCAISVPEPDVLPDLPLPSSLIKAEMNTKPTFFGHYWMAGQPKLLSDMVACLDWSVVKRNGVLAAYRFDGEDKLVQHKLVWV